MEKLKAGNPAPAFEATDQDGNKRTLADYAGRKLILYFYPKDNTPGCTAEACSLRDGRDELREMVQHETFGSWAQAYTYMWTIGF